MQKQVLNTLFLWSLAVIFSGTFLNQMPLVQAAFNPSFLVTEALAFSGKSKKTEVAKETKKKTKKKRKKRNVKKKKDPFYSSATLDKIYKRQAKRMNKIETFKKKGVIGESDSGLLKVRSITGLAKKQKQLMEKLVQAENSDRNKLFKAMEKGIVRTKDSVLFMRRRYFNLQRAADIKGTYFYQADHWHKN